MTARFVVHEHHATRLHYDFRLEMDGVLRSWAIPKGPSMDPNEKRLAVLVEDHNLAYINFEGIILQGYGAGEVVIWDRGTYDLKKVRKNEIFFFLNGKKLKGNFALAQFRGKGNENRWLLTKEKDQYASPGWELQTVLTPEQKRRIKNKIFS